MAYTIRLSEEAHQEYIDAYEWYELRKKKLGDRFSEAVEKRLQHISEHPEHFGKKHKKFREAKVDNFPFIVVYEVFRRKNLIHISAIYHSSRNPKKKFRKA